MTPALLQHPASWSVICVHRLARNTNTIWNSWQFRLWTNPTYVLCPRRSRFPYQSWSRFSTDDMVLIPLCIVLILLMTEESTILLNQSMHCSVCQGCWYLQLSMACLIFRSTSLNDESDWAVWFHGMSPPHSAAQRSLRSCDTMRTATLATRIATPLKVTFDYRRWFVYRLTVGSDNDGSAFFWSPWTCRFLCRRSQARKNRCWLQTATTAVSRDDWLSWVSLALLVSARTD